MVFPLMFFATQPVGTINNTVVPSKLSSQSTCSSIFGMLTIALIKWLFPVPAPPVTKKWKGFGISFEIFEDFCTNSKLY